MIRKIQTLTSEGWKDTVEVDNHSAVADKVFRVSSDGSMRLSTIDRIVSKDAFTILKNVNTGCWTGIPSGEEALVIDNLTSRYSTDANTLARVGTLYHPCKVKAYDVVDKNVKDALGGADELPVKMQNAVAMLDTGSRWQKLGAAWALRYIHIWEARFGGLFAPDENTAKNLQAIVAMTGQFTYLERGNTIKVNMIQTAAFRPSEKSVMNAEIQYLYDANGIYVRALRRDPVSGMIFVF